MLIDSLFLNHSLWQAVLDFATWAMNLTAANLFGPNVDPVWFELYQVRQEYKLDDLSPNSMDGFFQRMLVDDALFQRYFQYCALSFLNKFITFTKNSLFGHCLTLKIFVCLQRRNYYRNSDRRVPQGCDNDCRVRLLCFTVTTDIADQSRCVQIAKQIQKHDEF